MSLTDHREESSFDCVPLCGRFKTQCQAFVATVAFIHKFLGSGSMLLSGKFKLLHLLRVERPNHVETCVILESFKGHLIVPFASSFFSL